MNDTGEHTAVCKRIADIIRAANAKFSPEGVHPNTMGEIIAGELGLRRDTTPHSRFGDNGKTVIHMERLVSSWHETHRTRAR